MQDFIDIERTLVSDNNSKFFNLLESYIPVRKHTIPSSTECYDWKVPNKWEVYKCTVMDSNGNIIINSKDNILHLLNYSNSYKGRIELAELEKHLYYDKNNPDVIPYRTSYYSENWGICLSYNQNKKLTDEYYYIDIETDKPPGEMIIGVSTLQGKSDKEIILTSYYCHPNQANDGMSGVFLLIELYNKLKELELKYTYKFFFWPETIGCIGALHSKLITPHNTEYALVCTTVGVGSKVTYKQTFIGNHTLDNIIKDRDDVDVIKEFKPTGSDERQLSSKHIRIPTGVLTLTPYEDYPEYHTSADNIDLLQLDQLEYMSSLYLDTILSYNRSCEPFLTKYNMYRTIGTPGNTSDELLRNWILFYADGTKTIKDISKLSGYSEHQVADYIDKLKQRGVIE